MNSLDVLYYALAIGFLVLVGFISYAFYHLALVLESINLILQKIKNVFQILKIGKNFLKKGLEGMLSYLLEKTEEKGGKE